MARRLTVLALLVSALVSALLIPTAAYADGRVTIANSAGQARIDPTYATTLRLSGNGFQSIHGGHGGIYVFFGTVRPGWQPSKGGVTGADYFYVPDSEQRNNQGFQRYVAFPGSDTASSANGGTMTAGGSWSTQLVVPGAVFKAYDRNGSVRTIDCQKVTCGVITIGAHGVTNTHNETFTPVSVGSLTGSSTASGSSAPTAADKQPSTSSSAAPESSGPTPVTSAEPSAGKPAVAGRATLEVDRESAVAGHVLSFGAAGLSPGAQVSAVFDDGEAGAGPFAVGADGRVTGVITLPTTVEPGTHELRLYGVDDPPSVRFAVQPAEVTDSAADSAAAATADESAADTRAAWLFAGTAALVLLLALCRLGWRYRRSRRAAS